MNDKDIDTSQLKYLTQIMSLLDKGHLAKQQFFPDPADGLGT